LEAGAVAHTGHLAAAEVVVAVVDLAAGLVAAAPIVSDLVVVAQKMWAVEVEGLGSILQSDLAGGNSLRKVARRHACNHCIVTANAVSRARTGIHATVRGCRGVGTRLYKARRGPSGVSMRLREDVVERFAERKQRRWKK